MIVSVYGKDLTRGQVQEELKLRMMAMAGEMPAEQAAEVRSRMFDYIVDQFIMRTILLAEADRMKLTVSDEEQADALARIAKQLPPGKTVEQVMKESPVGEERMREELVTGLRVEKLVAMEMSNRVAVTEAEIASVRESEKNRLTVPDTVHARHILLAVSTNDDSTARQAKKDKIEGLRREIEDGADFAEVAGKNSDCPSKARGGDLGTFRRGQMVKEFEEAAFGQEPNVIGPVIETKFGYHIVQVIEKNKARDLTDAEVSAILRDRKRNQEVRKYFQELREKASVDFGPNYNPPRRMAPAAGVGPDMP
jgi:peptidyl-prolyl cis-trans isomerase C